MSPRLLDLEDRTVRFPTAYNLQPVTGWRIMHDEETAYNALEQKTITQKKVQQALAEGPWDGVESLYADAFEISNTDYTFHHGLLVDTPDIYFPDDASHPLTAYWAGKLPHGITDEQTENVFGVFRTLRTANFNEDGQQIDEDGDLVPLGPEYWRPGVPNRNRLNPDAFFYSPGPAEASADQLLRWSNRKKVLINWPAWCEWRDWNNTEIPWDDAKYTPRSLILTPTGGGGLDGLIEIRIATIRGADESSASRHTASQLSSQITVGASSSVQVSWLIKGDEETPAAPPGDITGYYIYYRVNGAEWHQISHMVPAARSYTITAVGTGPEAEPREQATAGLLRMIKRFECGLFFIPPYDISTVVDRICQISCADWQWSGLGTGTYRNDMMRFLSPEDRAPIFTLDLAHLAPNSFKTYPIDRRSRPNQIIVNFRDRNDKFLNEADPVILDRDGLQTADGVIRSFAIDAGTVFRSQAQRIASYYAKVLCDLDQMALMRGSPKTYHVLKADTILVTSDTADWTNEKFKVFRKGENVEKGVAQGDPLVLKVWEDGIYSDTADVTPVPRPLPIRRINPFALPAHVTELALDFNEDIGLDGVYRAKIIVSFRFPSFPVQQIAVIQYRRTIEAEWKTSGTVINEANSVNDLSSAYAIEGVGLGTYEVRVINSTTYRSAEVDSAPVEEITISVPAEEDPENLTGVYELDDTLTIEWDGHPIADAPHLELYNVDIWNDADTLRFRRHIVGPTQQASEFVRFGITDDASNRVVLLPEGGFDIAGLSGLVVLNSLNSASPSGGLYFEYTSPVGMTLPEFVSIYPLSTYGYDGGVEGALFWVRGGIPGNYWFQPETTSIDFSDYRVTAGPGTRFGINIRQDGVIEYYVNKQNETTKPIYVSGKRIASGQSYGLYVREFTGVGAIGLRNARWIRVGNEFKYLPQMQRADFGLGIGDPLPASIRVRVSQKNRWPGGPDSNEISDTFVR